MIRFLKAIFRRLAGAGVEGERQQSEWLGFDYEEEARNCIDQVRPYTMAPYARLVTLYQQAVFCEENGIPGDFIECGTWKGGAVGLMALASLKHGPAPRHVHLFDSFQGIPEPDRKVDGDRAVSEVSAVGGKVEGALKSVAGYYERYADGVGTLEINRHVLEMIVGYDPALVHYHQGWFQESLPRDGDRIDNIAILRLDGDWYASTKICLESLYPKVVTGGFVIVDDYAYYEGCRKAVDEYRCANNIGSFLHNVDYGARYWVKNE